MADFVMEKDLAFDLDEYRRRLENVRGRMQARGRKDWATGDRIRARLQELGVLLEDTPTGFKWRVR